MAVTLIKNDSERTNAYLDLSPNLIEFLKRIDSKDPMIKWDYLDRQGCRQKDGSYFRVIGGLRSAKVQVDLYKKGRTGVKVDLKTALFPTAFVKQTPATRYELLQKGTVTEKNDVATNAFAGESRHNWGLAVDICTRKYGDNPIIELTDGKMSNHNFMKLIGIVELAKDCGLSWGGSWVENKESTLDDFTHFEDLNYKIPTSSYFYDKNMNFAFVSKKDAEKMPVAGNLLPLIIGVVAYKVLTSKSVKSTFKRWSK